MDRNHLIRNRIRENRIFRNFFFRFFRFYGPLGTSGSPPGGFLGAGTSAEGPKARRCEFNVMLWTNCWSKVKASVQIWLFHLTESLKPYLSLPKSTIQRRLLNGSGTIVKRIATMGLNDRVRILTPRTSGHWLRPLRNLCQALEVQERPQGHPTTTRLNRSHARTF